MSCRLSGAQAHGRVGDNPLFTAIPGFIGLPLLYHLQVARLQHEFALLENAYERTRQRNRSPRRITAGIELPTPVQEKQQRQHGSAGQQDFQHEIRAPILPKSTQHSQATYDYLHW
jgi:hypothetical protein